MKRSLSIFLALVILMGSLSLGTAAEFTDIEGHWARRSIERVAALGLMKGVDAETFAPQETMTRAMFVTVLYRLDCLRQEIKPAKAPAETPFPDVNPNSWYAPAVAWAAERGVVKGIREDSFGPGGLCTREQAVTLVYRYLQQEGLELTELTSPVPFADAGSVSRYARPALLWAVGAGLLKGTDESHLSPLEEITRAQFAVIFSRLLDYLEGSLRAPEPVPWPEAPADSGQTALVDGREGCILYTDEQGARYVGAQSLAALVGGTAEPRTQKGLAYLRFDCPQGSFEFSEGFNDVQGEGGTRLLAHGPIREKNRWYLPTEFLEEVLGLSALEDPAMSRVYYTKIVTPAQVPRGYRVPILMYHAVSDNIWGIPELFVSPRDMEAHLKALVNNGYTPITFEDLDHIDQIRKPVLLTFDDGYLDNYTELFPLLKKYNVKATFFIIVDHLNGGHAMSTQLVKELSDSGLVSIQSHTMNHGHLESMNGGQLDYAIGDSVLALARITGKQPFVLCYPRGGNSELSRQYAAKYFQYGLCMSGPCFVTGASPFLLYRYYIPRGCSAATVLAYCG